MVAGKWFSACGQLAEFLLKDYFNIARQTNFLKWFKILFLPYFYIRMPQNIREKKKKKALQQKTGLHRCAVYLSRTSLSGGNFIVLIFKNGSDFLGKDYGHKNMMSFLMLVVWFAFVHMFANLPISYWGVGGIILNVIELKLITELKIFCKFKQSIKI